MKSLLRRLAGSALLLGLGFGDAPLLADMPTILPAPTAPAGAPGTLPPVSVPAPDVAPAPTVTSPGIPGPAVAEPAHGCVGGHCYHSGAYALITGPLNWAYWYPHGGFTVYPGQSGSGVWTHSDYSHVHWVVPPQFNAKMVLDKLDLLGIPLVPPEPMYLGKNPRVTDGVKLPTPRSWVPQAEPQPEPGKGGIEPENK